MVANPFFRLKIARHVAKISSASIAMKTYFPDPADLLRLGFYFIGTLRCDGCDRPMVARTARAAENGPQTFSSSHKKQDGVFAQWLGNHWYIATFTARCGKGLCLICHSRGSRSRFVAKSAESGQPVFKLMDDLHYILLI
jgi:hypothetical protein